MKKGNIKLFSVSAGIAGVLAATRAFAQITLPTGITDISGIYGGPSSIVCSILTWIFILAIVLSVVFVLVAAYRYLFSGGETEARAKAGKTLTYAAVGVAIAILARGFPAIVSTLFPSANATGLGDICTGGGGGIQNPGPGFVRHYGP
jgi:hypothetical protein